MSTETCDYLYFTKDLFFIPLELTLKEQEFPNPPTQNTSNEFVNGDFMM